MERPCGLVEVEVYARVEDSLFRQRERAEAKVIYVFPALGVSKRNLLKQNDLVCMLATRRPTIFYSHALGRCATGLPNVPSQYVYDSAS